MTFVPRLQLTISQLVAQRRTCGREITQFINTYMRIGDNLSVRFEFHPSLYHTSTMVDVWYKELSVVQRIISVVQRIISVVQRIISGTKNYQCGTKSYQNCRNLCSYQCDYWWPRAEAPFMYRTGTCIAKDMCGCYVNICMYSHSKRISYHQYSTLNYSVVIAFCHTLPEYIIYHTVMITRI